MVIVYFSGTGNSAYLAKLFARQMECECYSIEEAIDFEAVFQNQDIIAICYPIYGSCVPKIMRDFAAKHRSLLEQKKLIIFCSQMMFSGDGAKAFARLVPQSHVIYAEHFNMPNNISNFSLFPITEKERVRKKAKADAKMQRVCSNIKNGKVFLRGWSLGSQWLGYVQNKFWPDVERKQASSFCADESCTGCGLCVKKCPAQNLVLQEKRPVQLNQCMLCYRCVNLCPQKAATVMLPAKVKTQYKGVEG